MSSISRNQTTYRAIICDDMQFSCLTFRGYGNQKGREHNVWYSMSDKNESSRTENVWSSVLRQAGLKIGDPRAQENLVDRVPEGVEPDGILNRYDYREEKVRCSVCPNRQPHNIGITLSLPDGTKALCGSTCAEDLYGEDVWRRLDLDFKARERKAILADVVRPMTEIVNRSRSVALPWSGVASSVSHFLASLRRAAPTTFKSLAEIVRKRDSRLERGDGKEPWVVAGGACLLADVALMLPRLGEQFREVEALLAGNTDQVETLEHLSRLKGEIRNGMLDAAHLLAAAQQFIEPSNLRVVAKWANLSARRGSRHKVADTPEGLSYEIECGRDEYWDNPIPRWPADVTIPDRDTILRIFA